MRVPHAQSSLLDGSLLDTLNHDWYAVPLPRQVGRWPSVRNLRKASALGTLKASGLPTKLP